MPASFPLTVNYTQIVVHRSGLPRPGLLWDDDHVAQGFAWNHELVSFGVPDHDGECLLEVDLLKAFGPLDPTALWCIQVPFEVTTGDVDVGTILFMQPFNFPVGKYSLFFTASPPPPSSGGQSYAFRLSLTFVPDLDPQYRIVKQGNDLQTDKVLRTDAKRA